MKHTLTTTLAATLLASAPLMAVAGPLRMMVISDTHVMEPGLLLKDGPALEDYVAHDRKMLTKSPQLMEQATDDIIRRRPQVLLICGDLTKDGETQSHHFLCDRYLKRIEAAGIRVYVVPGNHDVRNPHAVAYLGDTTRRVSSPTAAEFAEIYHDYGYGEAVARDPHSLSYVATLDEHTRLLCLDACEYDENDFSKNTCVTAGRLKPETVDFIRVQARYAREHGLRLIAMLHHGVVQHWKYQDRAMSEYLVDDWRKVNDLLAREGIKLVFTGHFHAQDIAERHGVYDIETGSLVSYPSPLREMTLSGDTLTITTHHLTATGLNLPVGQTLQSYAASFAREGVHTIIGEMLPSKLPIAVREAILDQIGDAYVAHLGGDEQLTRERSRSIKRVARLIRRHSLKYAILFKRLARSLWTDLKPGDNNVTIITK